MSKIKNVIAALLISVVIISVTGCSSTTQQKDSSASSAAATADSQSGAENNFNATGYPVVNEKITLKGFGRRDPQHSDWNTMFMWEKMGEKTNVYVEWETAPLENYDEKLNLLLASNSLPDVIGKSAVKNMDIMLARYGSNGTFIDLTGLIDNYATNIKQVFNRVPEARQSITAAGGKIYSLPTIYDDLPRRTWRYPLFNMDWLAKLGLDAPTTQNELIEVLTAFKNEDANGNGNPTDEIPLSSHNFEMMMQMTEGMYGLERQMGYYINIEEGKLHIWLADENHKKALEFTKKLWSEGLIDKEIFTQTDKMYFGKLAAGRIGFTPLLQPKNAATHANEYNAIEPIPGPDGTRVWTYINSRVDTIGAFVITKANAYPEATIRWIDYLYGEDGEKLGYLGEEGKTYYKDDQGKFHYTDEVLTSDKGTDFEIGTWGICSGGSEIGFYTGTVFEAYMEGTPMRTYIDKVKDYLPEVVYPIPIMTAEDAEVVAQLKAEIDTYAKEMRAKFVMGEVDLTEWDSYSTQLDKLGIKELEEIYQKYCNKAN